MAWVWFNGAQRSNAWLAAEALRADARNGMIRMNFFYGFISMDHVIVIKQVGLVLLIIGR